MTEPLLAVEDLRVSFETEEGVVRAVDGVSFELHAGEVLAIVGESGAGKTVAAQTILGLTRAAASAIEGRAMYSGTDLVAASEEQLTEVRGADIAMIFQDALTALNPVYRIGWQIAEQIRAHERVSRARARARSIELLGEVGIPQPAVLVDAYPHELSGGMRQRALIAMAIASRPRILIADEPTTALDVTVQAQIVELLKRLRTELGSVILITHDLGVVAEIADRVLVMYAGMIVEQGSLDQMFHDPQHPYTWGLLGSIPRLDRPARERLPSIPGMPPSLIARPAGCALRPRCPHAFDRCGQLPPLASRTGADGQLDRCWLEPEAKRERRMVHGEIGLDGAPVPSGGG
jgi:peptide/nickel transport system ATP-binding protein/oligopeptide transport system ATP-binding protein